MQHVIDFTTTENNSFPSALSFRYRLWARLDAKDLFTQFQPRPKTIKYKNQHNKS